MSFFQIDATSAKIEGWLRELFNRELEVVAFEANIESLQQQLTQFPGEDVRVPDQYFQYLGQGRDALAPERVTLEDADYFEIMKWVRRDELWTRLRTEMAERDKVAKMRDALNALLEPYKTSHAALIASTIQSILNPPPA